MSAINTPEQICNLANASNGLKNSINNITTPISDKEKTFALWYDITRQYMLKLLMPNFALNRLIASQVTLPTAYALFYTYGYEYPVRCLKLLGIGSIDCTLNPPTVENGIILTNDYYADGAPLRIIDDVTDVSKFGPDFIFAFQSVLGKVTALSTTQDSAKKAKLLEDAAKEFANTTAQNAQENKPIRVSHSRFRAARYGNFRGDTEKR